MMAAPPGKSLHEEKNFQIYIHESSRPVLELFGSRQPDQLSFSLKAFTLCSDGREEIPYVIKKVENNGSFEVRTSNAVVQYKKGDFVSCVSRLVKDLILHIDIKGIGEALFPSSMLENVHGKIKVPVQSQKKDIIGVMNLDYLVIAPWENGKKIKIEDLNIPHWNLSNDQPNSRSLEMGHRGCGSTNGQKRAPGTPVENTMASFELAHKKGADYVELDVHLSKDGHPVVFHDFNAAVKATEHSGGHRKLLIPISDLSLEEMSSTELLLSHDELDSGNPSHTEENMPLFPSLEKVLDHVTHDLGIFVEVKYPMQDMNGVWEAGLMLDKNKLVDRTLDVVFAHGKRRKIIFGSFDPEICTLLNSKQSQYPVAFITAGRNDTWPLAMDLRCRNFEMAVGFAKGEGLMGISVYVNAVKDRMKEFSSQVKGNGLELFTWGDANMDKQFLSFQRDLNIAGIIYDRIHELK